jgi:hypothetical protein
VAEAADSPDWPLRALAALDREVAVDAGALVSRLVALSERLAVTSKDVALCWRPPSNELQLWACVLLPLCHGAQVVVPEPSPGSLAEALLRPGVTLLPASVADLRVLRGSTRQRATGGVRAPLLVTAEGDGFPELKRVAASRGARWVDAAAAMLLGAPP